MDGNLHQVIDDEEDLAQPEIGDALILGDECDEFGDILAKPATFLVGELWGARDRRNTQDTKWMTVEQPWGVWIAGGAANGDVWGLSRHPVSKHKEGSCIVLGSSVGGARKANAMDEMFAMGLDIDSGATMDEVIDRIEELGLCAVIYTTFSHRKTGIEIKRDEIMRKLQISEDPTLAQIKDFLLNGLSKSKYKADFVNQIKIADPRKQTPEGVKIILDTPPLEKFRVIFPLAEAVKLIDLAPTQAESLTVWEDKITGLAWKDLGVHFDTACTDPSRLFYTPRHPKGSEDWDAYVIRGKPLRFEDVSTYPKKAYAKSSVVNEFTMASGDDVNRIPDVFTDSGRHLNRWHTASKDRFMIADLLEETCPDKIRVAGNEASGHVHIECPFEAYHSSEGGTATMAINALDAQTEFWTVFCRHDSCQGRHKLEFLNEMIAQEWFDEELLNEDSPYMLEPGEEVEAINEPSSQDAKTYDSESSDFEDSTTWLPRGYFIKGGTIYLRGEEKSDPICLAFDVVGRSSNVKGDGGTGRIISFLNENNVRVEVTLTRADIATDGNAVVRELVDKGFHMIGRGPAAQNRLLDLLAGIKPTRRIPTVAVPGWVRDDLGDVAGYMHPTGLYSRVSGPPVRLLETSQLEVTNPKGTLEGWQRGADAALSHAQTNFHWPLTLASAFAGPLQGLLGWPPHGFNLSGKTSKGKTLAQSLGASAWGSPRAGSGVLFSAYTTGNAMEDLSVRGTHSFLAIDEIGALPSKRDLDAILFAMSSGRTKNRKAGRARGLTEGDNFEPFVVLSSENGIKNEIRAAGGSYRAGLAVRFPDIDVTVGQNASAEELAALNFCRDNFGHAGPKFIDYLLNTGIAADVAKLESEVRAIAQDLAPQGGAMARAAEVFALIQRGGEIAAEAGLLSDVGAVRTAVRTAWDAYAGSDEAASTRGGEAVLEQFRTFLSQEWDRRIIQAGATGDEARGEVVGFYDEECIYLLWSVLENPANFGVDVGKRAELVNGLGDAVLRKNKREAPQTRLPNSVRGAAGNPDQGPKTKNLRLSRAALGC